MHLNIIKNEVEQLKVETARMVERSEVEERLGKVGACISKAIESVNKELTEHISSIVEAQNWSRKKDIEKVKNEL